MLHTPEEAEVLEIFGGQFDFPQDYLVLDTETCGFSPTRDFVVDLGWVRVRDRKIEQQGSLLLDWSRHPQVDCTFIKRQLVRLQRTYEDIGRPFYYPWARLCGEGQPPLEALHEYITLIYDHISSGGLIVGHGFWRFDRKMLDGHTQRFLQNYLLPWRHNSILDTGLIEKALQSARPPYPEETLDEWSRRVNNARCKGVKWNLDMCLSKYKICERCDIDMSQRHTAGFDCIVTYYLMEVYRAASCTQGTTD